MKIEDKIEKANYAVTERDIEQLAAFRVANDDSVRRADGTYLRILVAGTLAKLGKVKRKIDGQALEQERIALTDVHTPFYAAVLRGVTTADIADKEGLTPEDKRARALERNRRSNFARSAASTLHSFIQLGGDVRTLEPATVKKTDLTKFIAEHRKEADPSKVFLNGLERLEKQAIAYMDAQPELGRVAIEECIMKLRELLDETSAEIMQPQLAHRSRAAPVRYDQRVA